MGSFSVRLVTPGVVLARCLALAVSAFVVPYGLPFAWPCSPVILLWTNKGCQYTITVFVQTKFYLWCVVWTASLCPCSSDLGCCLLRRCTCFASKNRVNTATYSSAISCRCGATACSAVPASFTFPCGTRCCCSGGVLFLKFLHGS